VAHFSDFLGKQAAQCLRLAASTLAHQAALDSVLPGELRGKVRLVSMATGCWVLYADHGAIAAKLRQMTLTLLSRLQARGLAVERLRIRTAVSLQPLKRPKQAYISSVALQHLRDTVATMPDSPLRQAFVRLIRHHGFD